MDTSAGTTHLLTVCGSLQRRSSNRAALDVVAAVARGAGAVVDDFERLAEIPPFDPDREAEPSAVLDDWRARLAAADAVLVAAPEYAGGVAGVVKNAFDSVVGTGSMYRKPIAVISAGTSGGVHARQTLIQTLTWQGGWVVGELGIAAPRAKTAPDGSFIDPPTIAAITDVTEHLLAASRTSPAELAALAATVVGAFRIDPAHVAPA
jgi:NAD(P)H-dependent FMN reductase